MKSGPAVCPAPAPADIAAPSGKIIARLVRLIFTGVFLFPFFSFSQQAKIDSLRSLLKQEIHDTTAVNALADIGRELMLISKYEEGLHYSQEAVKRAETALEKGVSGEMRTYLMKAQSKAYNNLGNINYYKGEPDKAIEFHLKALKLREAIGEKRLAAASENNIANVLFQKGDYDKALDAYQKAVKVFEEVDDKHLMALAYNNLGLVYQNKFDYKKGLEYLLKALKIREELGNKNDIAASYNNIGIAYNISNDFNRSEEYYLKSIVLLKDLDEKMALATSYNNLGDLYYKFGKYGDAKKMQLLSMELAREIDAKPTLLYAYYSLSRCDSMQGDFKSAYKYQRLYSETKDSIFNEESDRAAQDMQAKYDTEKKEHLIELLTKDGELQKSKVRLQNIIIGSIIMGFLLVVAFAVFVFNRLRITRKQKLIIEDQKKLVDQKNKHITDSINYAKRIQDSILPSREELAESFSDHFLFFRPREIVSGDFYWLSNSHSGKTVLAVADCTGHGVPGAFMSMIGNTLLNKIVNESQVTAPARILDQLNEGIVHALHQESRSQDDGMDISICLFEKEKITFAGANHSLYVVSENSLEEIQGDIYSIGSMFGKKDFSFSQKEVVGKRTCVFLSSDGYTDQRGGEKGKKFGTKSLHRMFIDIAGRTAAQQLLEIEKTFNAWKQNYAQLDDVLVMGIKL